MIKSEENQSIKIITLGEGRVGKTSLIIKYIKNQFDPNQESTINAEFAEKKISFGNGSTINLAIWDTAGQEKYRALASIYYKGAAGALLVYDITNGESFNKIKSWTKELKQQCNDIKIVIAGNKSDYSESFHQVKKNEAEEFAKSIGADHILTSAKIGDGPRVAFETLVKKIIGMSTNLFQRNPNSLNLDKNDYLQKIQQKQQKKGGGCC